MTKSEWVLQTLKKELVEQREYWSRDAADDKVSDINFMLWMISSIEGEYDIDRLHKLLPYTKILATPHKKAFQKFWQGGRSNPQSPKIFMLSHKENSLIGVRKP